MRTVQKGDTIRFKCLSCSPSCCSKKTIALTQGDLKRLELAVGKGNVSKFVMFRGDIEGAPMVNGNGVQGALTLKETEDGSCIFLQNERCSIHKHRPLPCRMYPFNPIYVQGAAKIGFELQIDDCPGVGCGSKASLSKTKKVCERWRKERMEYDQMVLAWNRRADGERDLLDFVEGLTS